MSYIHDQSQLRRYPPSQRMIHLTFMVCGRVLCNVGDGADYTVLIGVVVDIGRVILGV